MQTSWKQSLLQRSCPSLPFWYMTVLIKTWMQWLCIWVQNLHNQQDPYVQGVLKFLQGCMTKRNKGSRDPSTYVAKSYFMANPHSKAKEWGVHKFHECFPNLVPTPNAAPTGQSNPQTNFQLIRSIIQALNPQAAGSSATATPPGPTAPNYKDHLGMCQEEIDLHLHICGLHQGDDCCEKYFR